MDTLLETTEEEMVQEMSADMTLEIQTETIAVKEIQETPETIEDETINEIIVLVHEILLTEATAMEEGMIAAEVVEVVSLKEVVEVAGVDLTDRIVPKKRTRQSRMKLYCMNQPQGQV